MAMRQLEDQLLLLVLLLPSCSSVFGDAEGTMDALKPESKRSPETALAEKHYVFGFSTGYVGSTTLSNQKTYKNGTAKSRMLFEFEFNHRINAKYNHTHDDENNTYW
jgi:hypothetical protein